MDRLPQNLDAQWARLLDAFAHDDFAKFALIVSEERSVIVFEILHANKFKLDLDIAKTEVASRSFLNWNALRRGAAASPAPTRYYLSRSFRNFIIDYLRKQSSYEMRHGSLTAFDAAGEEQGQRDVADHRAGGTPLEEMEAKEQVALLRQSQLSNKALKKRVILKLKHLTQCAPDEMGLYALDAEERDWMPLAKDHPRPMPALLVERRIVRLCKSKRRLDFPSAWFVYAFGMARRGGEADHLKRKINLWDQWVKRAFGH